MSTPARGWLMEGMMAEKTPAQAAALVALNEATAEFHEVSFNRQYGMAGSDEVLATRDRLIGAVAEYETAMQQGI